MVSKKLFLERYLELHERIIPNIVETQEEEILRITKKESNSILWIYWHMVRTEDVGLSTKKIIFHGLKRYRQAVKEHTIEFIDSNNGINLSDQLSRNRIEQVICGEKIMPENCWDS